MLSSLEITSISFDHMNYLGNTLPLIAKEKAGIIKPNTPIVIGETQDNCKNVFIKTAEEKNSPIFFADKIMDCKKNEASSIEYQKLDIYKNGDIYLKDVKYPMLKFGINASFVNSIVTYPPFGLITGAANIITM